MENRKFVNSVFNISAILWIFILFVPHVAAYSVETHAALTQEIGKFYNQHFSNPEFTENDIRILMEGSRTEDNIPRPLNHFYDPVNETGLNFGGITWQSSKDWAQNSKAQLAPLYNPILFNTGYATALSIFNPDALQESDYAWQRAINDYAQGNKERGLLALGHILHLIEDATVPAHTRDDPHPHKKIVGYDFGNPDLYERWASRFVYSNINLNNLLSTKNPIINVVNLNSYFEEITRYTNQHFYSQDRIGITWYSEPISDVSESIIINEFRYSVGWDEDGSYKLMKQPKVASALGGTKITITLKDDLIFQDYWSRLSVKAVQYGAGVINLFFQEVEKAKNNPEFTKKQKSFLGKLVDSMSDFAGNVFGNSGKPDAVISLEENIEDKTLSKNLEDLGAQKEAVSINPTVYLDKFSVKPGEVIVESGSGFTPGSEAELYFKSPNGLITRTSVVVDSQGNYKNIYTIPANAILGNYVYYAKDSVNTLTSKELNYSVNEVLVEEKEDNQPEEKLELIEKDKISATSTITQEINNTNNFEIKDCAYLTSQSPSHKNLIINEIAWMGTKNDANDEWIELKNISGQTLDISGYQLLDKAEQIKIIFKSDTKISPAEFYLFERTNDTTVSNITADKIYVGALSNINEGLRLFDTQCNLIDEVLADPNWPAGSNSSKQTMERKIDLSWQTSREVGGTPKIANSLGYIISGGGGGGGGSNQSSNDSPPITTSSESVSEVNNILISEIQVAGVDAGDEFIELYNPTDSVVDMSGWSIQYVSGAAEISTSTVSKKNFLATSTIEAQKFFLIARNIDEGGVDGYTSSVLADMGHRSFSMSGTSTGAKIFLVSNQEEIESASDPDIIDFLDYSFLVPVDGQGLERKALDNSICVSSQDNGEFLGNGCDTGNNTDFEIRSTSNPQNLQSLPEPRNAPIAVTNFTVDYHFSTPTLVMNWDESQDYTGATSTITYRIEELNTPTSSTPFNLNTTSTALGQVIDEIGRVYEFSIKAVDVDGLASTSTVASTAVPSFVDNIYFYRDERASSTEYLVESYYSSYPFVSDSYSKGDAWKVLVFYHNAEAEKGSPLSTGSAWNPIELTNVVSVKYNECSSGSLSTNYRMILPDTTERCGVGGGLNNNARIWSDFEDSHLLTSLASSTDDILFEESKDYLTVAFYSLSSSGGGSQTLSLVAVDKIKYYFQDSLPIHQSPSAPTNLESLVYTINSPTSTVSFSWDVSTDIDSLDNTISYEWSLDGALWQSVNLTSGSNPDKYYTDILLGLGESYDISLRAVDDFNLPSATATVALTLPVPVENLTPDSSNSYFAIDEARIENNLLKIKWRLIEAPDTNRAFGIIPFLSASGMPTSLDNFKSLYRDYSGNSLAVARMSSQCSAAIPPIEDYIFGWQYETHFSAIGDTSVSAELVGQDLEFAIYTRNHLNEPTCNLGDAVNNPLFTGYPVTISN